MNNFFVSVWRRPRPWPFSWGPFGRGEFQVFLLDECKITITQREGQDMNPNPVVVECYSSKNECTVTMDFRGSSRFKRKTEF